MISLGQPLDLVLGHRQVEQLVLGAHRRARCRTQRGAGLDDRRDVAIDRAVGRVALDQPLVGVPDADAAVEAGERVVEQGLRRLGAAARLLGLGLLLLELGDVAVDRQHAAVGDRPEIELDDVAGDRAALVAHAAGLAHQLDALGDRGLDLGLAGERAEVAALGLQAHDVDARRARPRAPARAAGTLRPGD